MRSIWVFAGAALALGACTTKQEGTAGNDTAAANAADMAPQGPSLTAKLFGGGKPVRLEQQKVLENGMVVSLTSFQAKQDEAVLGVRIVNGADRDVILDWSEHKTFLVAGGQKYFLSPPVENADLKVTRGSKMEGELVFLGSISKGATVTLVVNEGMSDSQYNNTPGFAVPLQATEAAWSDDGSKKNSAA